MAFQSTDDLLNFVHLHYEEAVINLSPVIIEDIHIQTSHAPESIQVNNNQESVQLYNISADNIHIDIEGNRECASSNILSNKQDSCDNGMLNLRAHKFASKCTPKKGRNTEKRTNSKKRTKKSLKRTKDCPPLNIEQVSNLSIYVMYESFAINTVNDKQEAHGPRFAHLSDIATADMQMLCNIFPILSSQLMKIHVSSFEQFLVLKKNIWA